MNWRGKEYWIVVGLLVLVWLYGHQIRNNAVASEQSVDLKQIPHEIAEWSGKDFFFDDNVLNELRADQTLFRRYANDEGREVWLFIGYWRNQKYGAQPHSPLHCLPGSGWNIVSNDLVTLNATPGRPVDGKSSMVNFASIANGEQKEGMLYWYETRNGLLSKELSVKLDLIKSKLLNKPTDVVFIRITSPDVNSNPDASDLKRFWQTVAPHVSALLPFDT